MGGKPCIRGLRVTWSRLPVCSRLGSHVTEYCRLIPILEAADIDAALAYAAWRLEEREEPLVGV